jgi:serine/threonine-protein kinase
VSASYKESRLMPVPLEQFVKQLEDSGILSGDMLQDFLPPKAAPQDAEELAKELVRRKKLTKFQAELIWKGKGKSLVLGNYVLMEKIGQGGMGAVYKAEHRRMQRTVAVKMLPPEMMKNPAAAARFQREVVAAAMLRHPNIVAADDADKANGVYFLVLELVEGGDLSALVKKNGPLPVPQAVDYIVQAARGLEFAHGKGVVHRDIKPANLLLGKDGVVKILDMGLARIQGDTASQAELTATGTVMGTVDYMAPEQAISTKNAAAPADIYSLGCSLYYLLTGKATYDGETLTARLLAHQNHPIPALRVLRPDLPETVDAIFRKMVAKKVEDRYPTMSAVIAAFEQLGSGPSTGIGPVPALSAPDIELSQFLQGISDTTNTAAAVSRHVTHDENSLHDRDTRGTNKKLLLIGGGVIGAVILSAGLFGMLRTSPTSVTMPEVKKTTEAQTSTAKTSTAKPATAAEASNVQKSKEDQSAVAGQDGPSAKAPPLAIAPFNAAQARKHQAAWARHLGTAVETTDSIGAKMVLIPPGEFLMGSTKEQIAQAEKLPGATHLGRVPWENPQHRVVITRPFRMAGTEVTIGQFRQFVEATQYVTEAEQAPDRNDGVTWKTPPYRNSDECAVTVIAWRDATAFCKWLSSQEQATYRLPTEAEWEYACRAGTTTQYSFGDDFSLLHQYAWVHDNSGGCSNPVATRLPNPFGLFDMHGNALEWCQDWFDLASYATSPINDPQGANIGTDRVTRSGTWANLGAWSRSAYRSAEPPSRMWHGSGMRVVRESGTEK